MIGTHEEVGATNFEKSIEEGTAGEKQDIEQRVDNRLHYSDDEALFDVDDDIMDIIRDNENQIENFETLLDVVSFEYTQRDGEKEFEKAEACGDKDLTFV
ncbi:unnamed protein product [Ilex paraguariensis]|uniref:Uncharacterized protein n=1 Tax=Ilex paraguariensis TaxID=185542 RepID=A0ABC8TMH4_9AQUA